MSVSPNDLSERETEILRLVATGAGNKEIAQHLNISVNTVKVHLRNIFAKIGVTTRTEAALYAVAMGLAGNEAAVRTDADAASPSISMPDMAVPEAAPVARAQPGRNSVITGAVILFAVVILAWGMFGKFAPLGLMLATATPTIPPQPTAESAWHQLAPMAMGRSGAAAALFENEIFIAGGQTNTGVTNSFEHYNIETNTWQPATPKQVAVKNAKAAVLAGKIYIPGGLTAASQPTDILEIYSPDRNQWSYGKPLPRPIHSYALAAFEGKLYVLGGRDGEEYLDSIYVYNPDDNRWEENGRLPEPRAETVAVVISGKIFLIGGINDSGTLSSVDIFEPNRNLTSSDETWNRAADLPSGLNPMSGGSLADFIYLLGERNQSTNQSPLLMSYSPVGNRWEPINTPPWKEWNNMEMVVSGTRLYLLGGNVEGKISDQLVSYQALYTLWLPLAP